MQIPTKRTNDHKELGKHDTTQETNKVSTEEPKEMEIYKLSDKEFRIILLKKFIEKE